MADREKQDGVRIYGTPEEKSGPTSPPQGLRGENGSPGAAVPLVHQDRLRDGSAISVEEESGVAFAEVTDGATGADPAADRAREPAAPAALAPGATDSGNRNQVRDAGPQNVRDPATGRVWDRVDEGSDESFPASDPPASY